MDGGRRGTSACFVQIPALVAATWKHFDPAWQDQIQIILNFTRIRPIANRAAKTHKHPAERRQEQGAIHHHQAFGLATCTSKSSEWYAILLN